MPDAITPVGTQSHYDPMQGVNMLSGILGIQRQKQQLQQGASELQMTQQTAGQRSALAQYFQNNDLQQHTSPDGTIDLNVLSDPALRQAAGDSFPDVAKSILGMKNSQLEAKTRLASLNDELRTQFNRTAGSLREDPDVKADNNVGRAKVKDALEGFAASGGPDAARVNEIYGPMIEHVPKGKLSSALGNLQMQAQSATEQQGQQNPALGTGYDSRGNLVGTAQQKTSGALQQAPGSVRAGAPPQFVSDPITHAPTFIAGRGVGGGEGGTSGRGSGTDTMHPYPGEQADIATNQKEVGSVRDAAAQAAKSHGTNEQILHLSANTSTGPGTAFWRAIPAIGGMGGDDYQEVGKFLEKNAIDNMTAMGGGPSDARLSAAAQANGTTRFNPGALQAVTKFNDATAYGLERYRQGMDKAVGTNRPDYTKLNQYKSDWAKNFNMDVFMLENAQRRGDTADYRQILQNLGPARAKAALEARKNLDKLTTTGSL